MKAYRLSGRFAACALAVALAAGTSLAVAAKGQGPGAVGCPYGQGYGMGPGNGMGPGYGMGQGYGMGPGMMGGYGMGPGMMGGYGMGQGMMGGYLYGLDLSDAQRSKINEIQDETRKQHWSMMGAIMDEQSKLRDLYGAEKPDNDAIEKSYKRIGEIQQKMYESAIDAHKRMDAVLTDEQRAKMRSQWRRGWMPAQ